MGITTIRNIKYTGCDSSILLRMQFYFLFVVIFAVLSPPISAKHGSEKRNNALSMKKLLARKARSDDIYGDVFVDPSAVFPVQVDLSTLLTVVNNRISSIEQEAADARQQLQDRLDSAEAKVEQLRTDIDARTLKGSSFCQTGNVACDDCGGKDDGGSGTTEVPKSFDVSFDQAFPSTPTISVALQDFFGRAGGEEDWYGWRLSASDETTTGFTFTMVLIDRVISKMKGTWIACVSL